MSKRFVGRVLPLGLVVLLAGLGCDLTTTTKKADPAPLIYDGGQQGSGSSASPSGDGRAILENAYFRVSSSWVDSWPEGACVQLRIKNLKEDVTGWSLMLTVDEDVETWFSDGGAWFDYLGKEILIEALDDTTFKKGATLPVQFCAEPATTPVKFQSDPPGFGVEGSTGFDTFGMGSGSSSSSGSSDPDLTTNSLSDGDFKIYAVAANGWEGGACVSCLLRNYGPSVKNWRATLGLSKAVTKWSSATGAFVFPQGDELSVESLTAKEFESGDSIEFQYCTEPVTLPISFDMERGTVTGPDTTGGTGSGSGSGSSDDPETPGEIQTGQLMAGDVVVRYSDQDHVDTKGGGCLSLEVVNTGESNFYAQSIELLLQGGATVTSSSSGFAYSSAADRVVFNLPEAWLPLARNEVHAADVCMDPLRQPIGLTVHLAGGGSSSGGGSGSAPANGTLEANGLYLSYSSTATQDATGATCVDMELFNGSGASMALDTIELTMNMTVGYVGVTEGFAYPTGGAVVRYFVPDYWSPMSAGAGHSFRMCFDPFAVPTGITVPSGGGSSGGSGGNTPAHGSLAHAGLYLSYSATGFEDSSGAACMDVELFNGSGATMAFDAIELTMSETVGYVSATEGFAYPTGGAVVRYFVPDYWSPMPAGAEHSIQLCVDPFAVPTSMSLPNAGGGSSGGSTPAHGSLVNDGLYLSYSATGFEDASGAACMELELFNGSGASMAFDAIDLTMSETVGYVGVTEGFAYPTGGAMVRYFVPDYWSPMPAGGGHSIQMCCDPFAVPVLMNLQNATGGQSGGPGTGATNATLMDRGLIVTFSDAGYQSGGADCLRVTVINDSGNTLMVDELDFFMPGPVTQVEVSGEGFAYTADGNHLVYSVPSNWNPLQDGDTHQTALCVAPLAVPHAMETVLAAGSSGGQTGAPSWYGQLDASDIIFQYTYAGHADAVGAECFDWKIHNSGGEATISHMVMAMDVDIGYVSASGGFAYRSGDAEITFDPPSYWMPMPAGDTRQVTVCVDPTATPESMKVQFAP